MTALTIHPRRVFGHAHAPPSKSYTHRAYVAGALSGNGLVRRPLKAHDPDATLEGLHGLGFLLTHEAAGTRIGGNLRPAARPIDCRESGTTLRLLCGVASLSREDSIFTGAASLARRPITGLLNALQELGAAAVAKGDGFPIRVRGPLMGGTCSVPGDESSQFLSTLLMTAPLARGDTTIKLSSPLVSRPYVDMTLFVLRHHRLQVKDGPTTFFIPGGQTPRQRPFDVPGDYSSAAPLLAAAAVTQGNVTLTGFVKEDPQGDRAIGDKLKAFGADVQQRDDAITVQGTTLTAADLDIGDTPDLFPVLAAVAANAPGTSRLYGAPHLRHKESDRVSTTSRLLAAFGIRSEPKPDGLIIHGGRPHKATVDPAGDHRIAMAGAVLALAADGESRIEQPHVVAKSYPDFWKDLGTLTQEATA